MAVRGRDLAGGITRVPAVVIKVVFKVETEMDSNMGTRVARVLDGRDTVLMATDRRMAVIRSMLRTAAAYGMAVRRRRLIAVTE